MVATLRASSSPRNVLAETDERLEMARLGALRLPTADRDSLDVLRESCVPARILEYDDVVRARPLLAPASVLRLLLLLAILLYGECTCFVCVVKERMRQMVET